MSLVSPVIVIVENGGDCANAALQKNITETITPQK
jgi:hypothetical protein